MEKDKKKTFIAVITIELNKKSWKGSYSFFQRFNLRIVSLLFPALLSIIITD